eukprot:2365687-Amphidinium_carterae.1
MHVECVAIALHGCFDATSQWKCINVQKTSMRHVRSAREELVPMGQSHAGLEALRAVNSTLGW